MLDDNVETTSGKASISTMHLDKGLEFRTVVVMDCDDEIIPMQERIETVADDADLEEVYNTERHLLIRRLHSGPGSPAHHRRESSLSFWMTLLGDVLAAWSARSEISDRNRLSFHDKTGRR